MFSALGAVSGSASGVLCPLVWVSGWVKCLPFKGLHLPFLNHCRDTMGWLSVENKGFQDGNALERYWVSDMSLEDNQCPAAGCPRRLTDAKRGWLG